MINLTHGEDDQEACHSFQHLTVVNTMKNTFDSIKLNHATVEKWTLSQAVEELLDIYVSMSKGTVHEVVQKIIEAIYLAHGEDDQEVRHFFQHLVNACLEMLKSVCLHLLPFLRCFWEFKKEKMHLYISIFLDPRYYWMKNVQVFQESCGSNRFFYK